MGNESKRTYKLQAPGQAPNPQDNPEAVALIGIGDPDTSIEIEGRTVPLNDIVTGAFETSGFSVLEWNALESPARDDMIATKSKEFAQMFRDAGADLPGQEAARAAAQASVAARRAAREAAANANVPVADRKPTLPHRDEIDAKKIAAPVLTQQGWIVPSVQRQLPQNFR